MIDRKLLFATLILLLGSACTASDAKKREAAITSDLTDSKEKMAELQARVTGIESELSASRNRNQALDTLQALLEDYVEYRRSNSASLIGDSSVSATTPDDATGR